MNLIGVVVLKNIGIILRYLFFGIMNYYELEKEICNDQWMGNIVVVCELFELFKYSYSESILKKWNLMVGWRI